jgi:hypothetical protein
MLPFGAPDLPLEYHKHAWCPWFLTTIFIGEGEPFLASSRNGIPQGEIDLREKCKRADRWNISYPRGQWHVPPQKKSMAEISKCSVSSLFGGSSSAKRTVTFHSLNGSTLTLNASSDRHYLAFSWDGKRIPARFGGPIQLCFDGDHTDCQFFVYKADIEE